MIRRIALLFSLAVMILAPVRAPGFIREGQIVTIAAGTPVRISTQAINISRRAIQAVPSSSGGLVYVFLGVRSGVTPAYGTNPAFVLCPATATLEGCGLEDRIDEKLEPIVLNQIWVDGAHTGDKVLVSYNRIN